MNLDELRWRRGRLWLWALSALR